MDNTNEGIVGQARNCWCKLCEENFDYRKKLGKFSSTITGTVFDINIRDVGYLPPCKLDCYISCYLL